MGLLKRIIQGPYYNDDLIERDTAPLEGTNMSLWNSEIPNWWSENGMNSNTFIPGNAVLAERVWVANRCQQLNAQQLAGMPLKFHGPPSSNVPRWVYSPDSNLFPNGIGDAIHAIADQVYGWGFSCQYITDFYGDGYPRTWTVLRSSEMEIKIVGGARTYKYGDLPLDPKRVVQIDRNPSLAPHGSSAIRSYAQQAWGLLAAGNQSMSVSQGAMPKVYMQPEKKQTAEQANALKLQWMAAAQSRNGAPPIVPNDIKVQELSFNPSDLALLETQQFNAVVIASAYGVPAMLLNLVLQGGLPYQNPAMLGEAWWRFELRPMSKMIADAFSAQMLPLGQWVSFDAADTFLPLDQMSDDNDEQLSQVASASPAQQPGGLVAVSG